MNQEIQTIIDDIKKRKADIDPTTICEYLLRLSAELPWVGGEVAKSEQGAYRAKNDLLVADPKTSDARAETKMRTTDAWVAYRSNRLYYESLIEIIRSLKYVKRMREDEMEIL